MVVHEAHFIFHISRQSQTSQFLSRNQAHFLFVTPHLYSPVHVAAQNEFAIRRKGGRTRCVDGVCIDGLLLPRRHCPQPERSVARCTKTAVPLGEKAHASIMLVCPSRVRRSCPVVTHHNFIVESSDPLRMVAPSGAKEQDIIESKWPLKVF